MPEPRTLIVDGTNAVMFAAFGGKNPIAQAVPSALRMIQRAAKQSECTRILVALDGEGPTFRKRLCPSYKAGRSVDTTPYVRALREACQRWTLDDIITITVEGFEADDILATLAFRLMGWCYILSNDSDVMALVTGRTLVMRPMKVDVFQTFWPSDVERKYGITPHKLPLYKAIMGEKGDNIPPAVPGYGPKRTRDLIAPFPWEPAYWYDLPPQLAQHQQQIKANLQLTMLRTDVPLPYVITSLR